MQVFPSPTLLNPLALVFLAMVLPAWAQTASPPESDTERAPTWAGFTADMSDRYQALRRLGCLNPSTSIAEVRRRGYRACLQWSATDRERKMLRRMAQLDEAAQQCRLARHVAPHVCSPARNRHEEILRDDRERHFQGLLGR